MLTEQRYQVILKLLEEKGTVTVTELKDLLNTSESTVRRDIVALHKAGKLTKEFGGAVALQETVIPYEPTMVQKAGFTTPDANEALIKRSAMEQCRECFVLADYSKFNTVSSVTFAHFNAATIISDENGHNI